MSVGRKSRPDNGYKSILVAYVGAGADMHQNQDQESTKSNALLSIPILSYRSTYKLADAPS